MYVQVFQIEDKGISGVANVEAGIRRIFVDIDHQVQILYRVVTGMTLAGE